MIKKLLLIIACIVTMPTFTLEFSPKKETTENAFIDLIKKAKDLSTEDLSIDFIKKQINLSIDITKKKIAHYITSILTRYNQSNGK